MSTLTVYISIGNSDGKLDQGQWSGYLGRVGEAVRRHASQVHGDWRSRPDDPWQNACWCVELDTDHVKSLVAHLQVAAALFEQESIAWAEAPQVAHIRPQFNALPGFPVEGR